MGEGGFRMVEVAVIEAVPDLAAFIGADTWPDDTGLDHTVVAKGIGRSGSLGVRDVLGGDGGVDAVGGGGHGVSPVVGADGVRVCIPIERNETGKTRQIERKEERGSRK
jgi:hypothetical protein